MATSHGTIVLKTIKIGTGIGIPSGDHVMATIQHGLVINLGIPSGGGKGMMLTVQRLTPQHPLARPRIRIILSMNSWPGIPLGEAIGGK